MFEETHAEYDLSDLDELGARLRDLDSQEPGQPVSGGRDADTSSHYLMLRRNLLYTAITRAERVCVLVGTRSALRRRCAIRTSGGVSRAWRRACTSIDCQR